MKSVFILRHANWNQDTGELTKEGVCACVAVRARLPHFEIVISSDFVRTKKTARLLSGEESNIDVRAGVLKMNAAQKQKISDLRNSHPLGVAGAIFSCPDLKDEIKTAGEKLRDLIIETLDRLKDDEHALIISHDGTMVATKKFLQNERFDSLNFTFDELQGFIVDPQMRIQEF